VIVLYSCPAATSQGAYIGMLNTSAGRDDGSAADCVIRFYEPDDDAE
jgi:hypothetical protein